MLVRLSKGWWLAIDIAVKAALVGLLLFAVVRSDLLQFQGKAMTGRAIAYPVSAVIVPVVWLIVRRRRAVAYPFDVDILIVLPFLIDTAGNAANLYDTISWWDDANHFLNWSILVLAIGLLLAHTRLSAPVVAGLSVGFGAVTAYHDTLGDLTLGLSGSIVAASLAAPAAKRAGRARDPALRVAAL